MSWTTDDLVLAEDTVGPGQAGEETFTFNVSAANVSRVTLDLQVRSSLPAVQPIQVRVELTPPNGSAPEPVETQIATGQQSVDAQLVVDLFEAPQERVVDAASPEAAIAAALPANATAAQGEWTILVSIAGGGPGPLGPGFTIEYAASGQVLEGSARPDVPEVEQR